MIRKISKKDVTRTTSFVKKYWKQTVYWLLILAVYPISLFVVFTIGLAMGKHELGLLIDQNVAGVYNREVPKERKDADFAPFWEAWTLLDNKFVGSDSATSTDATNEQDRVWGAIQGLTDSYGDPFTSFLPPEENALFEDDIKGEFTGVGMEIGNRDGYLTVTSPLPKTPAARAGIQAKDIVSFIDDVDSLRMPIEQAVRLIRGEQGTEVSITVLRKGEPEPLVFTITRDVIKIPTLETGVVDDTFVIKLYSFTAKSPILFQEAMSKFIDSGKTSLVLDLRGNPGGYLEAAVSISSWFLDEGALVVDEDLGSSRDHRPHYSKGYNVLSDDLRMVVLTDGGSASASEIVAGALRDYNKALLVGDTTFGKGSVQELFGLTNDTALKITIAKWLQIGRASCRERV